MNTKSLAKLSPPLDLEKDFPVLPLQDTVLFPGVIGRFELRDAGSIALARALAEHQGEMVAVFTQKEAESKSPSAADLYATGTVAQVLGLASQPGGAFVLTLRGAARVQLGLVTQTEPYLRANVVPFAEVVAEDDEVLALFMSLRDTTRQVMQLLSVPDEFAARVLAIETAGALADHVANHIQGATIAERIELLEMADVKARVRAVLARSVRRLETIKMRQRIDEQVKGEMGKREREHVLRQQMKAIQEELGEGEEGGAENDLEALEKRVAEAKLSPEAADVARKQIKRLRGMQQGAPEYSMVRTYVEWLVDLPWTASAEASTQDSPDLAAIRAVLDADHYGLEAVKKRILEFMAVRKLKASKKGPILCLIGPPGVGKTSLGRSIARALGRKFHRVSLGGVHDEAAIRGHRRTYVGALPGNVIQGMKKVGTTNPVFVLDEVDKLGRDSFRGDPSSALLEVLDPEQNDTFADHYLDVPYDLSNVLFVATANVGDTIPAPLRDRMEIIEIPGYTRQEKHAIARRHLVPKQLAEHGIDSSQLTIADDAIDVVIERYTREAGVRSLEKQIAAIVRGVAVRFAEGVTLPVVVAKEDDVREFLGAARYSREQIERTDDAGVATGLAWTPVGGQVLFVEASRMPGTGKLTLTGQLGDVMKESAYAALSYVRANAERWGLAPDFSKSDLHIHIPGGAIPKDGPSAGVTMLSALVSVLTGTRVRHDVAMTGEITLRGRVLPIGGLKEKVLAAHRAGIKRIVFPERNLHDLEDIPAEVRAELEFVPVGTLSEVLDAVLEKPLAAVQGANVADAPALPSPVLVN